MLIHRKIPRTILVQHRRQFHQIEMSVVLFPLNEEDQSFRSCEQVPSLTTRGVRWPHSCSKYLYRLGFPPNVVVLQPLTSDRILADLLSTRTLITLLVPVAPDMYRGIPEEPNSTFHKGV